MHWVVQQNIFKRSNFMALVDALDRAGFDYSIVSIPRGSRALEPDVNPLGRVFVCGALKMADIAAAKGWQPGSLLNDNFDFSVWQEHLGDELLNTGALVTSLKPLVLDDARFVRPTEDTKAFDGRVFTPEQLAAWKRDLGDGLRDIDVVVAPVKRLFHEVRLFIVAGEVVTASLYRQAGKPVVSSRVDPDALAYARSIIARWQPAEAYVIDVALTDDGYKVIEFNNIHSSGFYACDVLRYVLAIQEAFGDAAD